MEIFGIICIVVLVLIFVVTLIPRDPSEVFWEDCRASGMSTRESLAAAGIRIAFVQLRRMASDECLFRKGDFGRPEIDAIADRLAQGLAARDPETAKSFLAWVVMTPTGEILYPDAVAAQMRHLQSMPALLPDISPHFEADYRAAFKVVRR